MPTNRADALVVNQNRLEWLVAKYKVGKIQKSTLTPTAMHNKD